MTKTNAKGLARINQVLIAAAARKERMAVKKAARIAKHLKENARKAPAGMTVTAWKKAGRPSEVTAHA